MKHFGALILMQLTQMVHLLDLDDPEVGSIVKGIEDRVYICPPKFVRQGNSCYYISTDNATWHDAHFKCQSMSKKKKITLAVLETKKEDRNLKQFLKSPPERDRWIGGIFNWKQKQWLWGPTGAVVKYNRKFLTRARRRQKDYFFHCIVLNAKRKYNWKAEKCLRERRYICETKLEVRKDPKIQREYQLSKNEIIQA